MTNINQFPCWLPLYLIVCASSSGQKELMDALMRQMVSYIGDNVFSIPNTVCILMRTLQEHCTANNIKTPHHCAGMKVQYSQTANILVLLVFFCGCCEYVYMYYKCNISKNLYLHYHSVIRFSGTLYDYICIHFDFGIRPWVVIPFFFLSCYFKGL